MHPSLPNSRRAVSRSGQRGSRASSAARAARPARTARRMRSTAVATPTADTTPGQPERQLLAALGRQQLPPAGLGAGDEGLLVGDLGLPALGLQPVVGDQPRVRGVRQQAGRDGATLEPPAHVADRVDDPRRRSHPGLRARQRAQARTGDPPVGTDVVGAVQALAPHEVDRRGQVVQVDELSGWVLLRRQHTRAAGERARQPGRAVLGQAGDRTEHGHGALGVVLGPVDDELLHLGVADRVQRSPVLGAAARPP